MIGSLVPVLAPLASAGLALLSSVQTAAGALVVRRHLRRDRDPVRGVPGAAPAPVTVLKPLHGDEKLLEAALESFCRQDHPEFQIVFGVQRADDPAIAVVERLRSRFPSLDMALVVDGTLHGPNRKVDNLINMLPHARHGTLVISDADVHAEPGLLRAVATALADPEVGLVTTLYAGVPADRRAPALLGAAQINQAFLPGVLIGRALGRSDCLGAVMALTRDTLEAAGGLRTLSPHLADDAVLGRRVRALGRRVVLAGTIPGTSVVEGSFGELFQHELRWGRTVRSQAPLGYPLSALQAPIGWALIAVVAQPVPATLALLIGTWALRVAIGRRLERRLLGRVLTPFWLAPVRDALTLAIIVASHAGNRVVWRGRTLNTDPETNLRAERAGSAERKPLGKLRTVRP